MAQNLKLRLGRLNEEEPILAQISGLKSGTSPRRAALQPLRGPALDRVTLVGGERFPYSDQLTK
jgi:hypothetical protein